MIFQLSNAFGQMYWFMKCTQTCTRLFDMIYLSRAHTVICSLAQPKWVERGELAEPQRLSPLPRLVIGQPQAPLQETSPVLLQNRQNWERTNPARRCWDVCCLMWTDSKLLSGAEIPPSSLFSWAASRHYFLGVRVEFSLGEKVWNPSNGEYLNWLICYVNWNYSEHKKNQISTLLTHYP